ncbi:phage major tail tube protein [Acuticoccus sp. M5D2P5]|nr:phage major tail tube protein [Acuticoccus kalidii]
MAIEIQSITPPMIGDLTDDFHGGGMPAAVSVPLGTTLSDASFSLATWNRNVIRRVGIPIGQTDTITFRGAAVSDVTGDTKTIEIVLTGRLSEPDAAQWERGSISGVGYTVGSIIYYKLMHGDELIHEVDILNMKKIVDGVDVNAPINSALGF